ncbi:MAG: CRTAC1 family protein [Phycisphaerales bacterium]|nr:CRTAC1 family protein [Phycisphaerales bacterium]
MVRPILLIIGVVSTSAWAGGSLHPFVDEASSRGVSYLVAPIPQLQGIFGFGCAITDVDCDGDQDVLILGKATGRLGVFENQGSGTFIDRTLSCGIASMLNPSGVSAADYDGDGDLDVLLTQLIGGPRLYRNDGLMSFTDSTTAAGLQDGGAERASSWADINGDGYLDLFIANYHNAVPAAYGLPSRLWMNRGDGTFEDIGADHDLAQYAYSFLGCFSDFDRDTDPDLYISNDRAMLAPFVANQLLLNDEGRLIDISPACGGAPAFYSMGIAAADIDGNGFTDFFAANIASTSQPLGPINPLFLGQPGGSFVESCATWGLVPDQVNVTAWAVHALDFDNDRDLDLHVCNQLHTDRFYINSGTPPMTESTLAVGLLGPTAMHRSTYGAATGDLDGDGGVDILVNDMGSPARLMMNHEGRLHRWARLRIGGYGANTQAIGALVEARIGAEWTTHEVLCGGTGYLGQSETIVHIGCAAASQIDEVRIRWPHHSGERTLSNLPAMRLWSVPHPSGLGDFDSDGDRDYSDRIEFLSALGAPFTPGSERADFDGDSDVDVSDAAAFDAVYRGQVSDFDGDGVVGGVDLGLILADWGGNSALLDSNHDGNTDGADLALLLSQWGP